MGVSGNTPQPGDTVRLRFDYEAVVDKNKYIHIPKHLTLGFGGVFVSVDRPDDLPDHWTVEVITPEMEEPTTLGTVVVVDARGFKNTLVGFRSDGSGIWCDERGYFHRWTGLAQPVRLATEEEKQGRR